MTDLTDGYHYAIVFDKERIIEKKKDLPIPYCEGFCCQNYQYLAPVLSYKEWQASEKYNKHLEEKIKIYERKDKQATETSIAYNELAEENTKLKELLKECRGEISTYRDFITGKKTFKSLIAKINQVLGEE